MSQMNIKKLSEYKLSHLDKINITLIAHLLTKAAVNPEYLKQISELLKRQLVAEKDTANYNTQVISKFIDKMTLSLRDAGQKNLKPTDGFKIEESIEAALDNREADFSLFDPKNEDNKNYEKFSFNELVQKELRAFFILRTEALDTFEGLIDEIDGLMPKYMSIQDWTTLKMAIHKGNDRLFNNKLMFLEPESYQGKESKFSASELEKFEIVSPAGFLKYDLRSDGPDLLALKELVSLLKGEEAHPLTIGPGFFAKYMPEILEKQIAGLVFKMQDNKLQEIKVFKDSKFLEYDETSMVNDKRIYYAPVEAATMLSCSYTIEDYTVIRFKKEVPLKRHVPMDLFKDNTKYYVVADGCVGGPKNGSPLGYKSISKNELAIDAGEVFLFEKQNEEVYSTRIYFVPYKYDEFHPMNQHGSVIFGNNDQSYHSCITDRRDKDGNEVCTSFYGFYRDGFGRGELAKNELIIFQPSFIAAVHHNLPKETKEMSVVFDIIKKENEPLFQRASRNVFEETSLIIPEMMSNVFRFCKGAGHCEEHISSLLKHHAPLHKRWLLAQYIKDGAGLTPNKQPTIFEKAAKDNDDKYSYKLFMRNFGGKKN